MLTEELRASMPQVAELLDRLATAQSPEARRAYLRQLGALWYRQSGEPEVLAELGLALVEQLGLDPGVA
ncbi:MAG TPA: histidine kinase, partial [Candidatus Competibacteraceae bacterium]|nr:histidine kinase [Candidatus Competibacteraceae bacterium]